VNCGCGSNGRRSTPRRGTSSSATGTFYRTIPLPSGAKADTLTARYIDGILEISALVGEPSPAAKTIPITVGRAGES
jgi:HSP20 family protein